MKQSALVGLAVIFLCAAGFLAWRLTLPASGQPAVQAKIAPPVPPAKPEWFQAEVSSQPVAVVESPAPAAAQAEAKAAEPVIAANTLTAETLTGTSWQDGQINVAFLPDGRWQMNGRICAKWEVTGNKVRIYDDKGEEHFVDIVGDSLAFNGQIIGRAKP